jgi:hypothetical protein
VVHFEYLFTKDHAASSKGLLAIIYYLYLCLCHKRVRLLEFVGTEPWRLFGGLPNGAAGFT